MEWVEDLLKLLFGSLGPLGAVCFIFAGYIAWLLHHERLDHKATRESVSLFIRSQNDMNMRFLEVLTEIKTILGKKTNGRSRS